MSNEIDLSEFQTMPRWACVAFASRCARRCLPVIGYGRLEGMAATEKVLDAVDAACGNAQEVDEREVFKLVDEIDDLEVSYRGRIDDPDLSPSEIAEKEEVRRVACKAMTAAKLAAMGMIRYSEQFAKHACSAYNNAVSAGCVGDFDDPDEAITNSELMYEWMRRDFDAVAKLAVQRDWNDQSPVSADVFGEMWPTTAATWALGQSQWGNIK